MIKKIIITKKGNNNNKKESIIKNRYIRQNQRIRTNVQEAITKQNDLQNKSLIIQENKKGIKKLVKLFKRNVKAKGIPVRITNIINKKAQFLKRKRPVVISKNEKGVNATKNLQKIKEKSINLVAFRTRAQAINYKVNLHLAQELTAKEVLAIEDLNSNTSVKQDISLFLELKEDINKVQLKNVQNFYQKATNALIYNKKELITTIKRPYQKSSKRIFKKLLLIKKRLNTLSNYSINLVKKTKVYKKKQKKEKIIYIQSKKSCRKIRKKSLKFQWKTKQQFLKRKKKGLLIKYKQKTNVQEKERLLQEFKNNKSLLQGQEDSLNTKLSAGLQKRLVKRFEDRSSNSIKSLQKRYLELYKYLILFKPRHKNKHRLSKKGKRDKIKRLRKKGGKNKVKRLKTKNNKLLKKVEKKQNIRVAGQIRKKVITLVVNEIDKKRERSKENVIKVLLNIIRGVSVGQEYITSNFGKNLLMYKYKYLSGIQNIANKAQASLDLTENDLQERLIVDFLNKKDFSKVLETETQLLRKFYEFVKISKEFPKNWVPPAVFQPFFEKFIAKKRDYRNTTRMLNQMTGFQKKYNIVNNIITIASENKIYNFKLPKKRLKVPTIRSIYKGLKLIGIPYYKTKKKYKIKRRLRLLRKRRKLKNKLRRLKRLGKKLPIRKLKIRKKKKDKAKIKVGVLKIKIRRRNMFLVFRDRTTNKVEAVTSARREYYRIFNTNDIDPMNKKKRNSKETTVKTKGPIGRYISTDHFRVRVLTQAFLDLRHKLRYKMLDIEIEKKYKKRFVRTIYKKYWYVFKPQGLFRICKFVKNKAHGQMRRKKARRI
jgi:hypothetical protein